MVGVFAASAVLYTMGNRDLRAKVSSRAYNVGTIEEVSADFNCGYSTLNFDIVASKSR